MPLERQVFLFFFLLFVWCEEDGTHCRAFQVGQSRAGDEATRSAINPSILILSRNEQQQRIVATQQPTPTPIARAPGAVLPLQDDKVDSTSVALVPLSKQPMMWCTSEPILSRTECGELSRWYNRAAQRDNSRQDSGSMRKMDNDDDDNDNGRTVLGRLQQRLNRLVLRNDMPAIQPSFLQYQACPTRQDNSNSTTVEALLPDGLHVDTNNIQFSRYLTVLVYLTTSQSSVTTFPLARPVSAGAAAAAPAAAAAASSSSQQNELVSIATQLLTVDNIQHTRPKPNRRPKETRQLEQAALDLYVNQQEEGANHVGLRLLPRQGHALVFCGIDEGTGLADPHSWHGAEALVGTDQKELLTFFYEIPYDFSTHLEFSDRVSRQKNALWSRYGGTSNIGVA
jgi:hypothetical protein